MRNIFIFSIILFASTYSQAQKIIHLDENGTEITKEVYQSKWSNEKLSLSRWDSIGKKGKRYATIKNNRYLNGTLNYNEVKQALEKIINREISVNSTILIEFYYRDDLCTSLWDNKWSKADILERKSYTDPIKKRIEKNNIIYVALFESGMVLKNKSKNSNEYYFLDEDGYFRKKIFINQTLCGSYALIKPNGETLVRNGEYNAEFMAEHLKPEIWNRFFNKKEGN